MRRLCFDFRAKSCTAPQWRMWVVEENEPSASHAMAAHTARNINCLCLEKKRRHSRSIEQCVGKKRFRLFNIPGCNEVQHFSRSWLSICDNGFFSPSSPTSLCFFILFRILVPFRCWLLYSICQLRMNAKPRSDVNEKKNMEEQTHTKAEQRPFWSTLGRTAVAAGAGRHRMTMNMAKCLKFIREPLRWNFFHFGDTCICRSNFSPSFRFPSSSLSPLSMWKSIMHSAGSRLDRWWRRSPSFRISHICAELEQQSREKIVKKGARMRPNERVKVLKRTKQDRQVDRSRWHSINTKYIFLSIFSGGKKSPGTARISDMRRPTKRRPWTVAMWRETVCTKESRKRHC